MKKNKNQKIENKKKSKDMLIIKIVVGLIILILYTILVVCVTAHYFSRYLDNSNNESNKNFVSNSINIENSNDEQKNSGITVTEGTGDDNTSNVTTIKLKDKVTKESKYEMTVVGYDFAKKVVPPNTSSFYTYYEAKEDGHQYLDIKIKYKNLDYTDITADDVGSVSIKFDNKYEYDGFCVIEDTDKDFTYANITAIEPLTEDNLHYLIDVPDEVAKGKEPLTAYINIGSDKYELVIRK